MVRAWVYEETSEDQRRPHRAKCQGFVPLTTLASKYGVLYWKVDPVLYDEDVVFTTVRAERGYKNRDIVLL